MLQFDDGARTRLVRNFEVTAELVYFCKQRINGQEELTLTNWKILGIVDVNILTNWSLELNQVAGGSEPTLPSGSQTWSLRLSGNARL